MCIYNVTIYSPAKHGIIFHFEAIVTDLGRLAIVAGARALERTRQVREVGGRIHPDRAHPSYSCSIVVETRDYPPALSQRLVAVLGTDAETVCGRVLDGERLVERGAARTFFGGSWNRAFVRDEIFRRARVFGDLGPCCCNYSTYSQFRVYFAPNY